MKKQNGPWQIINSQVKYQNPWISVREDEVIRPDGHPGIFGVVTMVPGASVLPIDEEGNVFLTKEFHYGVERVTIEVISGAIDEGETPIEAAKRELKEEVGLLANKWIPLGFIDPFTQIVACPNHLFIAEELSITPTAPEGTEQIETLKIPYDKAFEMVMKGKITHGASIAAILKAKIYLYGK